MSKNYTHLSLGQRYQIEALLKAGLRQNKIAHQLGVHPSTISRELRRNIAKSGPTCKTYVADNAQRRTTNRHRHKPKHRVFTEEQKDRVKILLEQDKWSPELISWSGKVPVSHEWIYQWIWRCKYSSRHTDRPYRRLYECLRHGRYRRKRGNRRDNRGLIPINRVSIESRPVIVNARTRLGDVEADLMLGKNHKGVLLVMTERATLHTRLIKLQSKDSQGVATAMIKGLSNNTYRVRTLTVDNDRAFYKHEYVAKKLNTHIYFTRPYTSQDKGTVENRIGVIRRFFPKNTDLTTISIKQIKDVETKLNNRPVRKFNYLTPNQVLQQKIALIT